MIDKLKLAVSVALVLAGIWAYYWLGEGTALVEQAHQRITEDDEGERDRDDQSAHQAHAAAERPRQARVVGRRGTLEHLTATPSELRAAGASVYRVDRGGDITYHGPGQLIGYPILDLRPDRCDVHKYVRDLEDVMIRAAGNFGVCARRVQGLTGAWVGADKLGAIGVRIARWITSHGFAFNVTTDLEYFNLIVPCGITSGGVTSLARATARPVGMGDAESAIVQRFCDVFDRELVSERSELVTRQPSERCKQRASSGAGRRGPASERRGAGRAAPATKR